MQTKFGQWLTQKLDEHGWIPADLTRASQTADMPRGLDSGLISRWLRDEPLAAVPTHAGTLSRLARAFRVTEAEVYEAAGFRAADASRALAANPSSLDPRLADFLNMIEAGWQEMDESTREVAERTARALFAGHSAVNTSGRGAANSSGRRLNNLRRGQQPPFQSHQHGLVGAILAFCSRRPAATVPVLAAATA